MAGPLNIPTITTNNLSFGPGVLYLGASGSTPSTEVGLVRTDANLEVSATGLDVRAGNPDMLIKRYIQTTDVSFSVTGVEWDFDNLVFAVGGATGSDQFDFGGDVLSTEYALKFEHVMPVGHTLSLYLWKVAPSGEMSITFGDELHEFPMMWHCLRSDTDWAGATISSNQYFRIVKATS